MEIKIRNYRNKIVGIETEKLAMNIFGIKPTKNRLYDGELKGNKVEIKSCLRRYKGRWGRVTFTKRQIKAIKKGIIRYIFLRVIDNYDVINHTGKTGDIYIIDTKRLQEIYKQPSWKTLVKMGV